MDSAIQTIPAPNFGAIKAGQHAAWATGDYARVGVTLQIIGEDLAEAIDPACGSRVLDIAAGNGNMSLAMARRWCGVTSTDYVGALLAQGRSRAEAENLPVTFSIADAEDLPYKDGDFDVVVSTFGVMYAPNQHRAASELVRVCRPGGKIGLANWTPEGFMGQLLTIVETHVVPQDGMKSPASWGDRGWIGDTFAATARVSAFTPKNFVFRYASPEHFVDFFRTHYGPITTAFLALDDAGQAALHRDMVLLAERFNTAADGSMRVPSEYAEIVLIRR